MECLRLRVKDIDFARNEITVRDGKGGKDRRTVLPASLVEELKREVERVRVLHATDLGEGFGEAWLPNAVREPSWQYLLPSSRRSHDPHDGKLRRRRRAQSAGSLINDPEWPFWVGSGPLPTAH